MSEAKHTPGPWTADLLGWSLDSRVFGFRIIAPGAIRWSAIAGCGNYEEKNNSCYLPEELTANAHLMAAAPELLAALKEAAQELYDSAHSSGDPYDPNNHQSDAVTFRVCRAAIAKAEGRS